MLGEAAEAIGLDLEEVKIQCCMDLNFLGALVLGEAFSHDFPETHLSFFDVLRSDILEKKPNKYSKFAFGLPRGFCKTTLLKLYVLWLLLFTDIGYILVVSATAELAEAFIADVCGFLDHPNIIAIFGNWRGAIERDRNDEKQFYLNIQEYEEDPETGELGIRIKRIKRILKAIGAQTSVRGTNIDNKRPEVIICEDVQKKEIAESVPLNSAFIKWFTGTLLKARSYHRCQVVNLGNMYNEICLLNILRKSSDWFSFIAPAILKGRRSLWPEFRTYASLMEEFAGDISLGQGSVFLAEVMNDPLAEATSAVDLSQIPAYPEHLLEAIPDGAFITIDPATGLARGDNTALTLHHVIDGKAVTRKIRAGKWGPEKTCEEALIFAMEEGATLIGVEAVAYQTALCGMLNRAIIDLQINGVQIVPVHPRGRSKNNRIDNYLKRLVEGTNPLHPDAALEIKFQASRWKPTRKDNEDDILDSAAYGQETYDEFWHLISYNNKTIDGTYERAHVWPVHLNSPI